jgi:uncharacterized protein (DUF488 family)
LWTVGHGARPLDAFVAVLASARIAVVVDVRQFPGTRTMPTGTSGACQLVRHPSTLPSA